MSTQTLSTLTVLQNKTVLRHQLLDRRRQIPLARRKEASLRLIDAILTASTEVDFVLSYASFSDELDTHPLNRELAQAGRLLLPRVRGDKSLEIYHVDDLNSLCASPTVPEPTAQNCKLATMEDIKIVIVPGLAFDSDNYRLGYGKGCYDRFLNDLPQVTTIGVGFIEQYCPDPLPIEEHDIPVDEIILV